MHRYQVIYNKAFLLEHSAFGPPLLFAWNHQINKNQCEGPRYRNVCENLRNMCRRPKHVELSSKTCTMLKGQCYDIQWFFCAFFARVKNGGCSQSVADIRSESLAVRAAWQPGHGHPHAGCWHDSAMNQRQVEPELHCFTCRDRRRQAALLFSGYEARARWYPFLQGSRLAATAMSISILYSGVWFYAPSEAYFGDLVAESMGEWEKESAVWS